MLNKGFLPIGMQIL